MAIESQSEEAARQTTGSSIWSMILNLGKAIMLILLSILDPRNWSRVLGGLGYFLWLGLVSAAVLVLPPPAAGIRDYCDRGALARGPMLCNLFRPIDSVEQAWGKSYSKSRPSKIVEWIADWQPAERHRRKQQHRHKQYHKQHRRKQQH